MTVSASILGGPGPVGPTEYRGVSSTMASAPGEAVRLDGRSSVDEKMALALLSGSVQ